jgi:hypothetical protein
MVSIAGAQTTTTIFSIILMAALRVIFGTFPAWVSRRRLFLEGHNSVHPADLPSVSNEKPLLI